MISAKKNAPAIFYQIKTSWGKGLLVTKKQSSTIDHFVNSIDIVNLSLNCTSCDDTLYKVRCSDKPFQYGYYAHFRDRNYLYCLMDHTNKINLGA